MNKVLNFLLPEESSIRESLRPYMVRSLRLSSGESDMPMYLLTGIDLTDRVALDGGAHAGSWTVALAERVGMQGTVISYEALPHYGRALRTARRLVRINNVIVRQVAVGGSARTVALRWRSQSNELLTGRTHIEPRPRSSEGV